MASKIDREKFKQEILRGSPISKAAEVAGSTASKENLSRIGVRLVQELEIENVQQYRNQKIQNVIEELSALI
jgi:hypothetical protein